MSDEQASPEGIVFSPSRITHMYLSRLSRSSNKRALIARAGLEGSSQPQPSPIHHSTPAASVAPFSLPTPFNRAFKFASVAETRSTDGPPATIAREDASWMSNFIANMPLLLWETASVKVTNACYREWEIMAERHPDSTYVDYVRIVFDIHPRGKNRQGKTP